MQRLRVRANLMRYLLNGARPLRERVRDAQLTDTARVRVAIAPRISPTGPTPARARSCVCRLRHRETLIPVLEVKSKQPRKGPRKDAGDLECSAARLVRARECGAE